MRLHQINEDNLAELERILPDLADAVAATNDNRLRVQLRRCKQILSDVRWGYGPVSDVTTIPAGDSDE